MRCGLPVHSSTSREIARPSAADIGSRGCQSTPPISAVRSRRKRTHVRVQLLGYESPTGRQRPRESASVSLHSDSASVNVPLERRYLPVRLRALGAETPETARFDPQDVGQRDALRRLGSGHTMRVRHWSSDVVGGSIEVGDR